MKDKILSLIKESIKTKNLFLNNPKNIESIEKAANTIISSLKKGNKILIMGNGGSAADAQHIAGELVGRFKLERKAIPAIALTTDSSILTAWSNDKSFETVFERQVEALAKPGDILLALSTSGNSENIIKAFQKGQALKTINISLTGNQGGKISPISDINININSSNTPRIQECHLLIYHIICELIEKELSQN